MLKLSEYLKRGYVCIEKFHNRPKELVSESWTFKLKKQMNLSTKTASKKW